MLTRFTLTPPLPLIARLGFDDRARDIANDGLRGLLARFCLDYLLRLACSRVWTPKTQPVGSSCHLVIWILLIFSVIKNKFCGNQFGAKMWFLLADEIRTKSDYDHIFWLRAPRRVLRSFLEVPFIFLRSKLFAFETFPNTKYILMSLDGIMENFQRTSQ